MRKRGDVHRNDSVSCQTAESEDIFAIIIIIIIIL
jgi:hypothetical protein